ncbi:MAG: glutaredoxin family protein [Gammaproteobacteria bacterium]|jgi:glutaredoxin|nr:glutaredoxin family protein [Gammaproteobacteria bacterium]
MRKLIAGTLLALSLAAAPVFAAITVSECVDAEGRSSFSDRCPAGTTKKGDRTIRGVSVTKPKTVADIAADNPVLLYTVPNCDACDLVRAALNSRGVPVTEKNVQDNAANQDELKTRTGNMTVPTMTVGTAVLTGYNRSAIDNALNQAGYPPPPVPGAPTAAN